MNASDFDYHPALVASRQYRQWWIVAASMIIGALIGLGFSYLFPPVYEAVFKVTTNTRLTVDPNITEIMVNNSLLHVGELVYQPDVLSQVIEEEKKQGINLTLTDLHRISSVERQITSTLLKIQWSDPQTAAQIANTWGKLFYSTLQEGYQQAILADELSQAQTILKNCLAGTPAPADAQQPCASSMSELEAAIAQNAGKIAQAELGSLGLYRELNVSEYQEAPIPTAPVRGQSGWMIAGGAGIGFTLALVMIEILKSPKKSSLSA
jgi:hypothetical protein